MNQEPHVRPAVSQARWKDAQAFEEGYWSEQDARRPSVRVLRRFLRLLLRDRRALWRALAHRDLFFFGDDYNYWWLEQFDGYGSLPSRVPVALEVGSGPQTNLRLIRRHCKISRLVAADPLIETYVRLRGTWVGWMHRRGRIQLLADPAEALSLTDGSVDLVVCINVLDHCRDARAAIDEMTRVLRRGGLFVLGTDLVDADDVRLAGEEIGHPLRLDHVLLDDWLKGSFQDVLRKLLPRASARVPTHHYGVYVYVGRKL